MRNCIINNAIPEEFSRNSKDFRYNFKLEDIYRADKKTICQYTILSINKNVNENVYIYTSASSLL